MHSVFFCLFFLFACFQTVCHNALVKINRMTCVAPRRSEKWRRNKNIFWNVMRQSWEVNKLGFWGWMEFFGIFLFLGGLKFVIGWFELKSIRSYVSRTYGWFLELPGYPNYPTPNLHLGYTDMFRKLCLSVICIQHITSLLRPTYTCTIGIPSNLI